jgi:hypothetical protein
VSHQFTIRTHRRTRSAAIAGLLTLAVFGCGAPLSVVDTHNALGVSEVELLEGLVQRVTVTSSDPAIDDEVSIRSVVKNVGRETKRFITNTCRLDFEGTLALTTAPDWSECKGLPHMIDLAPGDSVEVNTRQRVHGVAGDHEIRVAHVLEPLRWVPVRIRLRPTT